MLPLAAFPMHYYPAARFNPILPFNSKRSRLPNPAVRGGIATPVGATGSKVRFACNPEDLGSPVFLECSVINLNSGGMQLSIGMTMLIAAVRFSIHSAEQILGLSSWLGGPAASTPIR